MPDVIVMATARAVDASALGAYCEAVARFRTASQIVAHAGLLIKDRDGDLRRNPAVAQARDASAEMRAWAPGVRVHPGGAAAAQDRALTKRARRRASADVTASVTPTFRRLTLSHAAPPEHHGMPTVVSR